MDKKKAKSKSFAILGIPVGATLTFRRNSEITCKTADDKNRVEYQGKTYPISGLAKELMKTQISGFHAFKYNNVLLAKLGTADVSTAASVTVSVETTTPQTPSQATETVTSQTPAVMPLPTAAEATVEAQTVDGDPVM